MDRCGLYVDAWQASCPRREENSSASACRAAMSGLTLRARPSSSLISQSRVVGCRSLLLLE